MTHFIPLDRRIHERANAGEMVSDYCANCHHEFMEHTNGVCPEKTRPDHSRKTAWDTGGLNAKGSGSAY